MPLRFHISASRRNRPVTLIALVFLLQSILPAFQGAMAQAAAGYIDVVCTMYGPQEVFIPFDGEPEQETTACYECPVCILQLNPDDGVMCCPPTARGLFQTAVTEPGAALYLASDPLPYPRFLSRAPPA